MAHASSPLSLADLLDQGSGGPRGSARAPPAAVTHHDDTWSELQHSGTPWLKPKRSSSASRAEDLHASGGRGKRASARGRIDYSSLTAEQARVMEAVVTEGSSVFFTGAAGSGKSFLLMAIIQKLAEEGRRDTTFVTGTTGIAACNVGGVTIHSFSGVGLGSEPLPEMIATVERSQHAKKRWKQCRTLVIDEISMMDGSFFEKLAAVGSRVRHNPRPFGGIQIVLCGDFLQLPPVGIGQSGVCFCFEAPCWPTAVPNCVVLSSAFRYSACLRVLLG